MEVFEACWFNDMTGVGGVGGVEEPLIIINLLELRSEDFITLFIPNKTWHTCKLCNQLMMERWRSQAVYIVEHFTLSQPPVLSVVSTKLLSYFF